MDDNIDSYNIGNNRTNNGNKNEDQPSRPIYSMPGILHFLQTEWAKFEMDRAQWGIDRAELQARIAFLQGERKGQENLKHDLVRRIKMLEYALKQERNKYHKLKYGTDLEQGVIIPPSFEKENKDENIQDSVNNANNNGKWKQGRQLLRQYLQEVGYTDTIIDVRSARVRQLLGLQTTLEGQQKVVVNGDDKRQQNNNDNRPPAKAKNSFFESSLMNADESMMATFGFLSNETIVDDGDDDANDDMINAMNEDDREDRIIVKKPKLKLDEMQMEDVDTEEALAEFDFLMAEAATGSNGSTARLQKVAKKSSPNEEWGENEQMISRLKEQYKKERQKDKRTNQNQDRPRRSTLQAMLVNLEGEDDGPALQSGNQSPPRSAMGGAIDVEDSGCQSMMGVLSEDPLEAALGLGELADLSINNDQDSLSYDMMATGKDLHRKTWSAKFTLRSHFDGIRALVFHPVEPVLITASEDHLLKLWNLQKTVPMKRAASCDVEPVYTFRGHMGPVLSLAMSATGEQCYSAGTDGTIRCWTIPNSNIDPYDSFDPSVLQASIEAHTDAVWGLTMHGSRMQLLSCSSDGFVKLWSPGSKQPLLDTFSFEADAGVPTSIDFVGSDSNHFVVSMTSGKLFVMDVEKNKMVVALDSKSSTADSALSLQINKVICHPTLPVTITAHEDRNIRFFDNNSGKMIHQMVAHLDSVTSLAIDPSGLYLLSGSHDSSIRLWNLETKTCVQEMTSHRKKFDESIHDVTFHPSKPFIASAGADALAKVFI